MNFYNDNTYYSEEHFEDAINIGWIHPERRWDNCTENKESIVRILIEYLKYPVNLVRGSNYYKRISLYGKEHILGFSEMRIISKDRKMIYAVPNMIIYSILEQNYWPPESFLDVLLNSPKLNSVEYQEYLEEYNEVTLWGKDIDYINLSEFLNGLIYSGNIQELEDTIKKKKDVLNVITKDGSLLNTAIINREEEIALLLIEKGIEINKFNGIELLSAIRMKQNRVCDKLISRNVNVRTYDQKINPLFYAVEMDNIHVVESLLKSNYDLLKVYNNEFLKNCDIYDWAKRNKKEAIKDLLINKLDK